MTIVELQVSVTPIFRLMKHYETHGPSPIASKLVSDVDEKDELRRDDYIKSPNRR